MYVMFCLSTAISLARPQVKNNLTWHPQTNQVIPKTVKCHYNSPKGAVPQHYQNLNQIPYFSARDVLLEEPQTLFQ